METEMSNDVRISLHRNQINPKLFPEHTLTFAYGDIKFEKLNTHLTDSDMVPKLKALKELSEDMVDAILVIKAVQTGIPSSLIKLFSETSVDHRYLATYTVSKMCNSNEGRLTFI
jgi:hypothetical protein